MSDTPTPLNPVEQTNPLDSGYTTSEAKGSKLVVVTASVISALGVLSDLLNKAIGFFPADSRAGLWIAAGAGIIAAIVQITYTVQRTALKMAAINAGKVAAILFAFALPSLALAQQSESGTTAPATAAPAPATSSPAVLLTLPKGWTVHPGVTFGPALGYVYDFDTKKGKWTNNVSIGGQLVLDYKGTFAVGAGLSGTIDGDGKLSAAGDVMLAGPALPISTVPIRPAVMFQFSEAGAKKQGAVFATANVTF